MAKLIKGDNVQNIITDGDVLVTSPSKIGKTLDEVLKEQQSDIDRLKSNVKYIYAYGGVGGSGSGGSGTGSGNGPISILITLNGVAVSKSEDVFKELSLLLESDEQCKRLSQNAQALAFEKHNFDKCIDVFKQALEETACENKI